MDFLPFGRLFEEAKQKHRFDADFPAGAALSAPVPFRRGNKLYDAFFAYQIEYTGKSPEIIRPFCWMILSSGGGPDMMFAWCDVIDFVPAESYPPGSVLASDLPKALSPKKVEQLHGELMALYEQLRLFAFEETLNREQVAIIVRYKELFLRLCFSGLYPFYHALSPAFFHWLRLPLPEMKKAHIPKDLANTHDYQYQLLILETLQQMVGQFQEKIADDKLKQTLIDDMHGELQGFRNGLAEGAALSFARDIIQLIDSMDRSLKTFGGDEPTPENYDRLYRLFDGIRTDLSDILYRQGVDPFETPGAEIQVLRQKIISTVPTDDPTLDKTLAARLASGWEKDGRVIRPEHVSAYVLEKKAESGN